MKCLLLTGAFLISWAVSAAQDSSFSPKGIDVSVNEHYAPMGTAEKSINWDYSQKKGSIHKRPGYTTLIRNDNNKYTGIWPYYNEDGDKRLILSAQNTDSNFQNYYTTNVGAVAISGTSQRFIYRDETPTGAAYGQTFILANGKNRPYRFNGTDFLPLVQVPPGSFDFAPEKPSTNTDQVLDGKYYYGWQAGIPDSVDADADGFPDGVQMYPFADSMRLGSGSWQIKCDSDWVRMFNRPYVGPTAGASSPDSTIIRICRTKAGRLSSDSMFRISQFHYANVHAVWSFLDSIPDESLGVADSHPFVGFIDTVTRTADPTNDSLYRIGQPQYLSKDSAATSGHSKGIGADDSLFGSVAFRRYQFYWYDSSTSMLSPPSPYLRVPVDTLLQTPGHTRDSIITILTPQFDTSLPYWGILARAEEILGATSVDTLDPAGFDNVVWYDDRVIVYDAQDGACPQGGFIRRTYPWQCAIMRVQPRNPEFIVEPYYPVCTVKTVNTLFDTIVDSFNISSLRENTSPMQENTPIGQFDNVCVVGDRILMSYEDKVYFNAFTDRGSEIGYWPAGNAFVVGRNPGDEITALHPGDNYIDVLMNYSWYRARNTGPNEYEVFEIINNVGCIATGSVIDIPGGGLGFLAVDGFYLFGSHWASPYKTSGGNLSRISDPIWPHLESTGITNLNGAYSWLTANRKNLVLSIPAEDTSYVYSLNTGQWGQWDYAPRMTCEYDVGVFQHYGILPCSGTVFIAYDSDSIFRAERGTQDKDTFDITASWKGRMIYETGYMGEIDGFKIWKYSNATDSVITFNVYDIWDTGIVATENDTLAYRVEPKSILCPESEGFKIEFESTADSLTIDRIDLRYRITGPMAQD